MRAYVVRRLALVPLVALLVASATFFLVRMLPGDVVASLTAEAPQYGKADDLRAELGLNEPLAQQYVHFLANAARGDFGESLYFEKPVSSDLEQALPVTVELTILVVLIAIVFAVPLGVIASTRRNGPFDTTARAVAIFFQSIPSFWLGTLVLTFLSLWFAWTPPLKYTPIWENPWANLQQFIVPATVLGVGSVGLKLRLVRSQMLDVLSNDYIRTARAKGVGEVGVVTGHALRNAMVPVVAIIGNQTGALLGGATIVESIFNLPGLGRMLVTSVDHRDYPAIQAVALVTALLLVVINLITDLVYAWLDPRIRYA
jgi:peptide/nickel transport system permease protein